MAGSAAQGSNLVRGALEMLQKAAGLLALGSEEQIAVNKAIVDLSKHVGATAGAGDPAAVIQQLAQLARQTQQAPVPPALGGGAPPAPVPAPMAA
jgi:4-hydroxy-3-methylbut-2-enyl diphosphate reductase IspH